MDGAGSVLKVGPEGLADGLQVGGVGRRIKDDSEVLAELLGRWGCHLQRWETGGGGTAGEEDEDGQ